MVAHWLSHEQSPPDETSRAAVALQSFIQVSLDNPTALAVALRVCKGLRIDGDECLQWCNTRRLGAGMAEATESFVLDIANMKLPRFIESLVRIDGSAAFLYAYHNGHQTFAANDTW